MDKQVKAGIVATLGVITILYLASRKKTFNIIDKLPHSGDWTKKRTLPQIKGITVHHAASSDTATAYDFARHHVNNKGWPRIGYHLVIDRKGDTFLTNLLTDISYHNGFNNSTTIGISMVGNMENKKATLAQIGSLVREIRKLKRRIPSIEFLDGHGEYQTGRTSCPGKFTNMDLLRKKTGLKETTNKSKAGSTSKALYFTGKDFAYNPNEADN